MSEPTYLMPAEWERHQCCWMAWPRDHGDWPVAIEAVHRDFLQVLQAIAQFESVRVLVDPELEDEARRQLPPGTELIAIELDDCWMRDMGPTMVRNGHGKLCGVDWKYNGWGKFPHQRDQHVAQRLLERLQLPVLGSFLVNEGGALHVDGEGTCVLTESVLFNANRNPGLTRDQAESEVSRLLGIEKFIWIPEGLVDDDTDGHIDELMCFTAPGEILLLASSDPTDANYERLQEAHRRLSATTDARGRRLHIRQIEQPPAAYHQGVRLSRSYINCYIANGGVVMPAYGELEHDRAALSQLQAAFLGRRVVQVNCSALVTGGGNIHCITQQCPEEGQA